MATALDIISGGRLELGIGAGQNEEESEAYGIPLGTPAERSDRFEEACEVLTSLLSQEATTFRGKYYQLTDARNEPKGVQRPHPPICIGGSGEKRTLRTAARFAQHWSFLGGTPQEFAQKRDVLHAHCSDLGRDPSEILLSSPVIYDGDVGATVASAAALGEEGLGLAIIALRPPLDPAVLEPLASALSEIG
jgi:alkanesulfonate monooxygenase SsuD/methylene tetrahydromethanopterin reductase-like flavin-dependent oxidoreductase (luciferase family)